MSLNLLVFIIIEDAKRSNLNCMNIQKRYAVHFKSEIHFLRLVVRAVLFKNAEIYLLVYLFFKCFSDIVGVPSYPDRFFYRIVVKTLYIRFVIKDVGISIFILNSVKNTYLSSLCVLLHLYQVATQHKIHVLSTLSWFKIRIECYSYLKLFIFLTLFLCVNCFYKMF